jgi:hypothetical protein
MAFTIRPNRLNMQWIKRNTEKAARKGEKAALDRWTTEGGYVVDETNAKMKQRVFVYRRHKQKPLQRRNNP